MAVLYQVWVPAVAVAHLIGLSLLAYSLEKVSGIVSKTAKRITRVFSRRTQSSLPEAICPPNTPQDVEGGQAVVCTPTKASAVVNLETEEDSPEEAGASKGLGKIPPAILVWHEVTCDVLDRASLKSKRVLSQASGSAQPGEVVGLLGPSGAGKSTLLDILAKRKTCGRIAGTVTCNGEALGADFKRRSAYVPQEDVFVPTLCALETVQFAAQLRLPGSATAGYRSTRVKQVMKVMGLWRSRNTQVGGALPGGILVRGLSGGEKRRLSIACALVSTPSILFLDEPTTGLDSYAALNVMAHMNALAAMGQTIILSVHQPRAAIFEALHKVDILSEGRSVYFGAPSLVVNWFDKHLDYYYSPTTDGSVSDWVIDLVSVGFAKGEPADPGMPAAPVQPTMKSIEDVNHAADIFACMDANGVQASSIKMLIEQLPQAARQPEQARQDKQVGHYAASWGRQFTVLAKRHLLGQLRNPTDSSSRLLMSCYVGLLAGLVFFNLPQDGAHAQEHLALLFFVLLLYQLLPFCYMSFFVADRRFYAADVANGLYSPSAYYAATMVSSAPFIVLNTVIGSLAAYGLGGLNAKFTAVLLNVMLVALQSLVATQFQIACVLATPNQDLAFVFATAYVACSILWSGFYIRVADMKVSVMRGLSWVSYTKYAMMGVSRVELQDRVYDTSACSTSGNTGSSQELPGGSSAACMPNGQAVLSYWGYDLGVGTIFAILIGFYLVCHLVSYLSLRRMRERR